MFWFHFWFISKPFNSIIDWTLNHIRIDIKIGNVFKSTSNCQNWINSLCFQKFSFLKIAVNYLVTRQHFWQHQGSERPLRKFISYRVISWFQTPWETFSNETKIAEQNSKRGDQLKTEKCTRDLRCIFRRCNKNSKPII